MQRLLPLALLAAIAGQSPTLHAQLRTDSATVHTISAAEAVSLALTRRVEVLNADLDVKNQAAFNREVTGAAYPQIAGSAGLQRNFNIPVTVLPDFISPSVYGILEGEGVQDGNGNPIKSPGSFATFPAQFGVPWQASVGLSIQQLLFQPDVFVGLKARDAAIELYENQKLVAEDSVRANVYKAYYGVLVARKGLQFSRESESRLALLYQEQQALFENGFIEKLDLDKTRVNVNNVRSTVSNLTRLVDNSMAALKFALSIPQRDSLVLTDTLSTEIIKGELLAIDESFSYEDRDEIKALNSSRDLLEYQVQRFKLQAYPTVGAFWNMATNAQRLKFDFFNDDRWFFSNIAGLNISIPIFDGNQRRSRVKQAEYALSQNINNLNRFKEVIDLQVISSRTQFVNAIISLEAQEENKELAEQVFATTKIKYEQGLGSSFEVLQQETALQDALNNYYNALYNAILARINYLQALGRLP